MKFHKQVWNQKLNRLKNMLGQNQAAAARAGSLLAIGIGLILSVNFLYQPKQTMEPSESSLAEEAETVEETLESEPLKPTETAGETAVWTKSLKELNLAHFFPEGADPADKTQSLGGQAFKELMTQDEQWMNDIYDYADFTPAQLAKKLGKDPASIMGSYNPRDDRHNPEDPSTWSVNTFKNVRMTAQDGDGKAITPYSNVLEIMSMANTYAYYQNAEDYELFISYAKELWNQSHSYQVGISEVYYCGGCLSEDAERLEMEALEEKAKAEEQGLSQENPLSLSAEETSEEKNAPQDSDKPSKEESVSAATSGTAILAGAYRAAKEAEAAKETTAVAETVPESRSPVIVAPVKNTAKTDEAPETTQATETYADAVEAAETAPAGEPETVPAESGAVMAGSETRDPDMTEAASPSNASLAETSAATADENSQSSAACPGHVDLMIHMKITGLHEQTSSLFTVDTIGNDAGNIKVGGWPGWNKMMRTAASRLSLQDWFERYGLTVSNLSPGNPLSPAEINSYMALLPLNISQTRRNLIRFALESVGRVPYYWGGKPSSPDYASNRFGILTSPDYKGRVLKGLDCSGWINWVYWSVTGKRLAYESTSGLAVLGRKINRSELQPGDIIVRTGTEAHVIMFLGWTPDGRIQCIHESSSPVNNVTVAVRDANWPYYRSLAD